MGGHGKYLTMPWQQGTAALVSLVIAYGFVSLAIDSGSYWHYIGAFAFIVLGVRYARYAFSKRHGKD